MEVEQSRPDELQQTTGPGPSGPQVGGWTFPLLLVCLLLGMAWLAVRGKSGDSGTRWPAAGPQAVAWTPSPPVQGASVELKIDFGNGVQKRFAALRWQPGMTVEQVLQEASTFRPGISYQQQGQQAGGFLTALDGLSNEGAGGRNWKFEVDGQHAQMSFCLQPVPSGGHVLWKFATEE